MARRRSLRPWGLALIAVCVVVAGDGSSEGAGSTARAAQPRPVAAVLSATADVAVLPARVVDEVRSAGAAAPSQVVALGAVLTALLGLPGLSRRTAPAVGHGRPPIRSRRHSIALRAPPTPVRTR